MKDAIRSNFVQLISTLLLVALTPLSALAAEAEPAPLSQTLVDTSTAGAPVEGQYIVTLDPRIEQQLEASGLRDAVRQLLGQIGGGEMLHLYENALTGFSVKLDGTGAALLRQLPGVVRVEQDQFVHAIGSQQNPPSWGLDRIDERTLPLDNLYEYPVGAGRDVNVYVLDTGIRASHQDFENRVGEGRNFAVHEDTFEGWFGIVNPDETRDCNGHGTHVSSTAAGMDHGVARKATIIPVRVLNCSGGGTNSGVIAGIDWVAANHQGPAVANMSLGGGTSQSLDDAVRNAIDQGVTFAVAAGNDDADACNTSPARVSEAITVGATTREDARSSFSNHGSCVDLFAPGTGITAAWNDSDSATNTISGTSMAAPHVAGAAALYRDQNEAAQPVDVKAGLLAAATTGELSAIETGSPNQLLYVDSGGSADQQPVAEFSYQCNELTCSFDASASEDDNAIASWNWTLGDGATASGEQISHQYAAGGDYDVTLTVTDTINQTDRQTQTVSVSALPECSECTTYEGSLNAQETALHPGSSGFSHGGGTLEGYLQSPAGFDMALQRRSCTWFVFCSWSTVDSDASEIVTDAASGRYRWRVAAGSQGGSYRLQAITN